MDADDLQAMRDLFLQFDRRAAERDRRHERNHQAEMANIARLDAKSDQLLADSRATLQALLRMLDRLDGGGPATA
jgi:hypothetical protein